MTKELVDCGANVIVTTRAPADIPGVKTLVSGVEMTDDECGTKLAKELKDQVSDLRVLKRLDLKEAGLLLL